MKKIFIFYLLTLIFTIGINIVFAEEEKCTYTYAYTHYYLESTSVSEYGVGATLELKMPSKKGKVTNTAKVPNLCFTMSGYSFSDDATLINWDKKTCPLYIVSYEFEPNWYGFDEKPDLSFLANEDGKLASTGAHVFLNDGGPEMETYTCHYRDFDIEFDEEGKAISIKSKIDTTGAKYSYKLDKSLTAFPAEKPGVCENVSTCATAVSYGSMDPYVPMYFAYNVYSSSMDLEAAKEKGECLDNVMTLFEVWQSEDFSEESGDNPACRTFRPRWDALTASYTLCKGNNGSCKIYNQHKNKFKLWCSAITKYVSYDDGCLQHCFELNKKIAELENKELEKGHCGFSERLILWIANIIRWVKYIIPVAVIVLGILDFIKAIAADKEDEMKKAQQRFMRRLIAAALIFIAPFIIGFILNKLGFDANGCGIINL